jgi:hypothetical protein
MLAAFLVGPRGLGQRPTGSVQRPLDANDHPRRREDLVGHGKGKGCLVTSFSLLSDSLSSSSLYPFMFFTPTPRGSLGLSLAAQKMQT